MDAAAIRRERRRQKILEGGKNRLDQIQSTLYKQMPPVIADASQEGPEPDIASETEPESVEHVESNNIARKSPESVTESQEADEIDALNDDDLSVQESQDSFVPEFRLSPAEVLAMQEIDAKFQQSSSSAEPLLQSQEQTSASDDVKSETNSKFAQKLADLLVSVITGFLAVWWALYSNFSTGYHETLRLLKQCMYPATTDLKCQDFEWQQQGTSVISVYLMVQLIIMSSRYLSAQNQQQIGVLQALKQLNSGFAVFLLTFVLTLTALQ